MMEDRAKDLAKRCEEAINGGDIPSLKAGTGELKELRDALEEKIEQNFARTPKGELLLKSEYEAITRLCLANELHLDSVLSGVDGHWSKAELVIERGVIKGVSLFELNIKDISDLSDLSHLEHLSLQRNKVKDLSPLSKLMNLKVLDLRANEFEKISPLAVLKQLEEIDLRHNYISRSTDFRGFPKPKKVRARARSIMEPGGCMGHDGENAEEWV